MQGDDEPHLRAPARVGCCAERVEREEASHGLRRPRKSFAVHDAKRRLAIRLERAERGAEHGAELARANGAERELVARAPFVDVGREAPELEVAAVVSGLAERCRGPYGEPVPTAERGAPDSERAGAVICSGPQHRISINARRRERGARELEAGSGERRVELDDPEPQLERAEEVGRVRARLGVGGAEGNEGVAAGGGAREEDGDGEACREARVMMRGRASGAEQRGSRVGGLERRGVV